MRVLDIIYVLAIFNVFYLTPLSIYANIIMLVPILIGITKLRWGYYRSNFFIKILIAIISLNVVAIFFVSKGSILDCLIGMQSLLAGFASLYFWHKYRSNASSFQRIILQASAIYIFILSVLVITDIKYIYTSPLSNSVIEYSQSKLSRDMLYFLFMYFLSKISIGKSPLLFSIGFIALIIVSQYRDIQRGDIIVLIPFIFWTLYKVFGQTLGVVFVCLSGIIALFVILGPTGVNLPTKFSEIGLLFDSSQHSKIEDPSLFVRLKEIEFAVHSMENHPFIGHGFLRGSTLNQLTGEYFYPSDIGIWGVYYRLGLLCVPLYLIVVRHTMRLRLLVGVTNPYFMFALFYLLYTVKDGSFFNYIGPFGVIYACANCSDDGSLRPRKNVN